MNASPVDELVETTIFQQYEEYDGRYLRTGVAKPLQGLQANTPKGGR